MGPTSNQISTFAIVLLSCALCCISVAKHLKDEQGLRVQNFNRQQTSEQRQQLLQQNCTQYYPRIFYTSSRSKMLIKFNTLSPCNRSYVTIVQKSNISKFYCNSSKLMIEQKTIYIRYIQNCLIEIKSQDKEFNYSVFGAPFMNYQSQFYYQNIYRIVIPQGNENFNMIVTADWGPMKVRPYQTIYPSLLKRISNPDLPIHAILLIGDLAYDLATNECAQYDLFMQQLAVVSPYFPIIPIYGNHECNNDYNFQIFKQSFECYNLSESERVQSYHFWNFKLVTFNPYLQIYQKSTNEKYQIMREALLRELGKGSNQFTILSSHYPIICSQDVFHCQQTLLVLRELYRELSNLKKVDLYLGAHMHQYERIVSFQDGNFITTRRANYTSGQMPSIVEGVAGCDVGIIDEDYPTQSFSVSHSYNRTGYGILTVSQISGYPSARYVHYITPSAQKTQIFDTVQIKPSKSEQFENALHKKQFTKALKLKDQ